MVITLLIYLVGEGEGYLVRVVGLGGQGWLDHMQLPDILDGLVFLGRVDRLDGLDGRVKVVRVGNQGRVDRVDCRVHQGRAGKVDGQDGVEPLVRLRVYLPQ
jgi:hypothetical protein